MPFIFDGVTRTITEQPLPGNPSIANYDILRDLWSAAEDWYYSSDNQKYAFPFRQSGGGLRFVDDLGNEVYATFDIFLQNQAGRNWRIIPADYQHIVRFSGANLFAENRSLPIYDLSTLTNPVIVEPTFSDVQTSYIIYSDGSGGGGLTPTQATQLASVDSRTARVDALIENVNGEDRFTQKALEQAPVGSGGGGTGATPQQIWEYSSRSLTDKAGFSLSTSGISAIVSAVWSATTRTLTSVVSSFSVADIWSHTTRSLTDKAGFAPTALENAQAVESQLADDFASVSVDLTPVLDAIAQLPTDIETALQDDFANVAIDLTPVLTAIGNLNDISNAEVLAEVNAALSAYDSPTKSELDNAIAALDQQIRIAQDLAGIAAQNTQPT